MQTRLGSLVEKVIETFLAFILSFLLSPVFLALCGIESTTGQNFNVVLCFTALALVRGYLMRRLFNYISYKKGGGASK